MIVVREVSIDVILDVHARIPEFAETKADRQHFEERYGDKEKIILCAYEGDAAVGYIVAYDKFADGSFYCWMAGVIPEYRKHGALTAMMDYLIGFAYSKDYNKIKIKTRNDKRDMLKFLVKNNFNFKSVEERENIKDNRINLEKEIV